MLWPDWIILYAAIIGGCALILGFTRAGKVLLVPAALRWILLPAITPAIGNLPLAFLIIALPLLIVFGGIVFLGRAVGLVSGDEAGGHVAGSYFVRTFDAIARALWAIITLPFRLLRRR